MFQAASEVKSWHYGLAQKLRTKFIYAFDEIFKQVNFVATPSTACKTFKISETDKESKLPFLNKNPQL